MEPWPCTATTAIVLRTQKLGEADRIVTLLTRQHGQVRAVAKGVRRTRSRFGARLEPFMLVDVQLYEGARSTSSRRPRRSRRTATASPRDYAAYTAAHRDARDGRAADRGARAGRCSSSCCWSVACARWPAASTTPGWCSTPSCCARSPSRAGRRASTTARAAAPRARTGLHARQRAARSAPRAARPARRRPRLQTLELLGRPARRRLGARRRERAPAPPRGQRPGRRLPAVAPRARAALAAAGRAAWQSAR